MYFRMLILVCALAISPWGSAVPQEPPSGSEQRSSDLPDGDSAAIIAVRLLSSDRSPQNQAALLLNAKASTISITDSLAKKWTGSDSSLVVWKVELKGVKLALKEYRPAIEAAGIRDFTVYLDSTRGVVYRIVSSSSRSESKPMDKSVLPLEQTRIVFPDHLPKTSLFDALDKCIGNPHRAFLIDVAYVMREAGGLEKERKMRAVWDIHLYGVGDPMSWREKRSQGSKSLHCRTLIDADTGEFLFGSN